MKGRTPNKADANLIAAAPALLEALEELSAGMLAGEGVITTPRVPGEQVTKARAAIALAKGERVA